MRKGSVEENRAVLRDNFLQEKKELKAFNFSILYVLEWENFGLEIGVLFPGEKRSRDKSLVVFKNLSHLTHNNLNSLSLIF